MSGAHTDGAAAGDKGGNDSRAGTHRAAAFTLVELLVVIGIIALLISILLPSLNAARKSAQSVKCLANLRSIGQAINIYAVGNRGSLPPGYTQNGTPGNFGDDADWQTLLMSSALGRGGATYTQQAVDGIDGTSIQQLFTCPSAVQVKQGSPPIKRVLHYSCHPRLMPVLELADGTRGSMVAASTPRLKPYRIGKIRRSSDILMVFDGAQILQAFDGNAYAVAEGLDEGGISRGDFNVGRQWNYMVVKNGMDLSVSIFTRNQDWPLDNISESEIRWRHGRGKNGNGNTANAVYADGHAGSVRLREGVDSDVKLRNIFLDN